MVSMTIQEKNRVKTSVAIKYYQVLSGLYHYQSGKGLVKSLTSFILHCLANNNYRSV